MQTSARRRAQIKLDEGFANPVSDDGFGNPTGGWGHIKGVRLGQPVSVAQGEAWLTEDIDIADAAVRKYVKVPLTQGQWDVLSSFVMNLGGGALAQSTLLRKLNAGDYASVRTELLRWDHADPDGAGPLPPRKVLGLTRRRQREANDWTATSAPLNPIDPSGSRTVNGGATTTVAGGAIVAEQVNEVVQSAQWNLLSGNSIGIIIGLIVLGAGLWVIYSRLDDAGQLPWKKRSATPSTTEPLSVPETVASTTTEAV